MAKNITYTAIRLLLSAVVLNMVTPISAYAKTKITVNGAAITSAEISSRTTLLQAMTRKSKSSARKEAIDQLVLEELFTEEAKKFKITVPQSQVNDAYAKFAKNVKMTSSQLTKALKQSKINPASLKEFLKTRIIRDEILKQKQKTVEISNKELKDALAKEDKKVEVTYDFLLQQVTFIKSKKRGQSASSKQARAYRNEFTNCETGAKTAKAYKEVAVRRIGRRSSAKLLTSGVPENIVKQLESLPVGGISDPFPSPTGSEMLAICKKSEVESDELIRRKLRIKLMNDKFSKEAEAYLDNLKKNANIVYK